MDSGIENIIEVLLATMNYYVSVPSLFLQPRILDSGNVLWF